MQLRTQVPILALLLASPAAWAADVDWLIVPGERIGAITPASSEAELRQIYGDENVAEAEVNIGFGDRDIPSDQPSMQKLDPKVYQIIMQFER